MSKINFYYAYGLFIASTIIFPELSSSNSSDYDISIKFGRKGIFPIKPNKKGSNITKYNINDIGFIFNGKTVFRVRYGKEILINPDVELHEVLLRSLILGQGMGILLHQKGYLVIHGSAVNINGFGAAFIGNCGQGKSTTAVALNTCGYPIITDDVLLVDVENKNNIMLIPSFPRVKLWADVIEKIRNNLDFFTQIDKGYPKYSTITNGGFDTNPIPLKTIYVIENGEKNGINQLNLQEALIDLIKQSFLIRTFDKVDKSKNFNQCTELVRKIPMKNLTIFRSLDKLKDLTKIIEEDFLISDIY